jgi:Ca-activated chloride channel family protein
VYVYSLASTLVKRGYKSRHPYKKILALLRYAVLILLGVAALEPQLVDTSSRVKVQGIDIMVVLDVSGSMQLQDFSDDNRSRLEIAKDEAIHFVRKRTNDALGMVIFARDALSRCPLTHDKKILEDLIGQLSFDSVDPRSTMLAKGLLLALNRLRSSEARSKVIIVLTDGEPSEDDLDIKLPIKVAQELGVKIYAIGIGEDHPVQHGFYLIPGVNKKLLDYIAGETGGQSYMARSAGDMRAIYSSIDALETTDKDVPVFSRYHDVGSYCAWGALALLVGEWLLNSTVWFGL